MKTISLIATLGWLLIGATGSAYATSNRSNPCDHGFHCGTWEHRDEYRDHHRDRNDIRRDIWRRNEYLREGDYRNARRMSRDIYYDRMDLRRDRWDNREHHRCNTW